MSDDLQPEHLRVALAVGDVAGRAAADVIADAVMVGTICNSERMSSIVVTGVRNLLDEWLADHPLGAPTSRAPASDQEADR